jgi:hypothetical protein
VYDIEGSREKRRFAELERLWIGGWGHEMSRHRRFLGKENG